ncbi:MAG: bifunctional oligoribonuclease/PAP phosphatase NrnA [Elusimicrobiaceae bacterium]|jgi:phosphoesterase RecJ-like protein|nr:bifunctional oligoribonuclease/PAP phosphatase NrnA [Elusimicrobiaceae bacterium]
MPTNTQSLQAVWQAIRKGKRFFIAGHLNPDGDSLGCTLAMTSLLERMGKTVYAYASPAIGADLQFLPGISKIHVDTLPQTTDFDTVILLECSDRKRGGDLDALLASARTLINIDHHLVSDAYGDVNHIDSGASSTAEIIFQLFEESNSEFIPTKDEATALYTGVVTDTGRFVHSNTTAEALRVASALVALGADIAKINQVIYFTKPYIELKLQGRALEKMQLRFDNKYSEIILTHRDFETFGATPAQTQGIVSQPTMIPGVEISALIKEEPDKVSVNLRSRGAADVSQIAQTFGGGGHARAAGFKITGKPIDQVAQELADVVADVVKKLA